MKILHRFFDAVYIVAMISFVMLLFMIPKCSTAQTRFMTAADFDSSKMRGFNISLVNSLGDLSYKNLIGAKATGANHVRYWMQIMHDANGKYFFSDRFGARLASSPLKTLDSAVRLCEKLGIYLIPTIEVLPRQGACDWWGNTTYFTTSIARKAGIKKIWVDSLARRYKDKKIIAAYDLMNEPRKNTAFIKKNSSGAIVYQPTNKEYVQFTADLIAGIRAVDPNHAIVVEVLGNSMLYDLAYGKTDSVAFNQYLRYVKNLIYSPHGYSPMVITHQGTGIDLPNRRIYPDTTKNDKGKITYVAGYFDSAYSSYWKQPAQFKKKYKAVIWVGEFSCINWAPKNMQGEWTNARWIKDAIKYMESQGWSWAYHARKEYQGWDSEYSSEWYTTNATFYKAKPSKLPPTSVLDVNAPAALELKAAFLKNK